MAMRHGRVARTPVSSREPEVLAIPTTAEPQRVVPAGREAATREEIAHLVETLFDSGFSYQQRLRFHRGVNRVLDWLETFAGENWQDRWLISGSNEKETAWVPDGLTTAQRNNFTLGNSTLIVLRVIRPSYRWLSSSRMLGAYDNFRRHNQSDVFAELEKSATSGDGYQEYADEALNALTRIVIVTGKDLRELDMADLDDYSRARRIAGRKVAALPLAYQLLRSVGGLAELPATLREARNRGQKTVAELVDQYPIAETAVRDVLVHYLVERSAAMDYATLVNHARKLVYLFWVDLEQHHPGICSLNLPDVVAAEWKRRLRTLDDGSPRRDVHSVLFLVRSFYLDLQQWALEDPARWAAWSVPCPVREADLRGYTKMVRQRQARMQERTRALVPVVPRLVAAAEDELAQATRLLTAVRDMRPGEEFTVDGRHFRRTGRQTSNWRPSALFVTSIDEPGPRFDAERREDTAFWTFAIIEVLRRTGARIEELLELTHLSLRQYHAPTGEMVPLLQISPSKTDRERVIPADPELVAILARIIRRIKGDSARVPLISRYDNYERTFGPKLPHLFQRSTHHQLQVLSPGMAREMLVNLADRADIVDVDGSPLRFTPHDFRRVFSTETVNGGLPIHIAAKVLGHLDLNTTQGYVAVYPEQVISHYRRFVDQRRTHRPSEEYREPTDQEWNEFRDHFSLRRVALGRCDRPYGTPCQHEHACIRCPMLRMSLSQVPRLLEIETNTHERLEEARRMRWLGEVAALEESLRHIANKKEQSERLRQRAEDGDAGVDALS